MFIAESVRSENHQGPRPETRCLQYKVNTGNSLSRPIYSQASPADEP